MTLREWWRKPWSKNLVFFGILGILYFTNVGEWVSVQFTQWNLEGPGYIEAKTSDQNLHQYMIRMKSKNGESVRLSDFKGSVVFLNMWASWCVPCLAEFEGLAKLQQAIPDLAMVVMNVEDEAAFNKYVDRSIHDLPFYRVTSPLPKPLTAPSIPASYIIDKEGNVVYRLFGAADWSNPGAIEQIKLLMK